MVGVAGKSTGCATCRRRKVKCDAAKPACVRCQRSNIYCEGYERYAIFIDRNQQGYRRRAPLEEVIIPQDVSSSSIVPAGLIGWFCEDFTSTPRLQRLRPQQHWLSLVVAQSSMHPALESVLLAIACNRWSRTTEMPEYLIKGRELYQRALGMMQRALPSPEALLDDILAAACSMTIYELYDPTTEHDSWVDHMEGLQRLICFRGPASFTRPAARAILEHVRGLLMVKHLNMRSACVFGSSPWRGEPWQGASKTIDQQIFDQGLALTVLMERERSLEAHPELAQDCLGIIQALAGLDADVQVDFHSTDAHDLDPVALLLYISLLAMQLEAAHLANRARSSGAMNLGQHHPLATKVIQAAEVRMQQRLSPLEKLRLAWSIGIAMQEYKRTDPEQWQCQALLQQLQDAGPFVAIGPAARST